MKSTRFFARLAAIAAGLAALGGVHSLQAAVIGTRPAEPVRLVSISTTNVTIDINGDRIMDFNFHLIPVYQLSMAPMGEGRVIVPSQGDHAKPLHAGIAVGSELAFEGARWSGRTGISAMATVGLGEIVRIGQFFGLDAYIGIEFPIEGQVHYGWIRLDHFEWSPGGYIVEWAYESTPGVPIRTGPKPVPMAAFDLARPGFLRLGWAAETNRIYQIQAKTSWSEANWTTLEFALPAATTNLTVDLPTVGPARYFRVIEVE